MAQQRLVEFVTRIGCLLQLVLLVGCSVDADAPTGPPATPAEAAKAFDLSVLPLPEGAAEPNFRHLAGASYEVAGTVKDVFAFLHKQLTDQGWKEQPDGYISDQSSNATFARQGYKLSLAVSSLGKEGHVHVTMFNHGNVALSKLPVPEGLKPFYGSPVSAAYITDAPVEQTAAAIRKLLVDAGWQPYGGAGDVQSFKQNAIRLDARVLSAPAQGGKTVVDYSTLLMSVDLPAPDNAEKLQYSDRPSQLFFDTPSEKAEVVDFFKKTLGKAGWENTTDNLIRIDFKEIMIFRNPPGDLLELEVTEVEGKRRVLLRFQTAAEVAELERLAKEAIEREKMKKAQPLPKLAIMLPDDASQVEQTTPSRIEFKLAGGKARPVIESLRKQLKADGWEEEIATLEDIAGALNFTKGEQRLGVMYNDTRVVPAEVSLSGHGVELERAAENK